LFGQRAAGTGGINDSRRTHCLTAFADRTDALLHYIPLHRKAPVMADDPQKDEDQHVKDIKKKSGAK
jgi:hypothetical protein